MASVIIHLCVAKKVNEYLKMNEKQLFLGTIAPDISKQIGQDKSISHFIDGPKADIPNLNLFLSKYKEGLTTPFTMGYYIHLLTDYYWFQEFLPPLLEKKNIKEEDVVKCLYQDYTSVNIRLIDDYLLSLEMFYNELDPVTTQITEIPIEKLNILVEKMGVIIENSTTVELTLFDYQELIHFIEESSNRIVKDILKIEMNEYNI